MPESQQRKPKLLKPVLFAALVGLSCLDAHAVDLSHPPSARNIMQAVEEFDDGNHMVAQVAMVLTDRNGTQRERKFVRYVRNGELPTDKYSYIHFHEPAQVAGTTVLAYDYRDQRKDNDSWIYLPAVGKVKRLTTEERTGKLMGSDISYGDLTRRNLNNYEFKLLGEVPVGAWKTWHVEFVPTTPDEVRRFGYVKGHVWVDKQSLRVVRSIFWKAENAQTKLFDVKTLAKVDGIWTPLDMVFAVQHNGVTLHHTRMTFSSVRYNQPVDDRLFTPDGIARPPAVAGQRVASQTVVSPR